MSALRGDSVSTLSVIQSVVIAMVRWRGGTQPGGTSGSFGLSRLRNGRAGGRCGQTEMGLWADAEAGDQMRFRGETRQREVRSGRDGFLRRHLRKILPPRPAIPGRGTERRPVSEK